MEDKIQRDNQRHPEPTAGPKYPNNKIHNSPSGHKFEIDDTPGKERIFEGHRSGTYREISADGKLVESVVANKFSYVKGTSTITVDGFLDVKVDGSKVVIVGGSLVEILGKCDIVVYGDADIVVAKDAKVVAKNILLSADKDINIEAGRDINMTAKRNIDGKAKNILNIEGKNMKITATEDRIDLLKGDLDA